MTTLATTVLAAGYALAMGAGPALAQAAAGPPGGQGSVWTTLVTLYVPIIAIMYFLLIRPQQQKAKQHQAMLDALKKGDEVVTSGGVYGKVHGLTTDVVRLEVAPNVIIRIARGNVRGKVTSGTGAE